MPSRSRAGDRSREWCAWGVKRVTIADNGHLTGLIADLGIEHLRRELQAEQTAKITPVEQIDEQTKAQILDALAAIHAPQTRRVYRSAWLSWVRYAEAKSYCILPARPEALAAYLCELANTKGRSTSCLSLHLTGIRHVHEAHQINPNPARDPSVMRVQRGLRRLQARPARQAQGLTLKALAAIEATACRPRRGRGGRLETKPQALRRGLVDIALCRVLRDGLLRRGECAALCWGDLEVHDDGSASLLIRESKTDPDRQGAVCYLSQKTALALDVLRAPSARPDAAVFGLGEKQIGRRVQAAARAAGLGEGFGGHSGRVGMAQDLTAAGVSLPRADAGRPLEVATNARSLRPPSSHPARRGCPVLRRAGGMSSEGAKSAHFGPSPPRSAALDP